MRKDTSTNKMACFECKKTLVCVRSGDCCRFDHPKQFSEAEDISIRRAMYARTGIIYPFNLDRFTISITNREKQSLEIRAKELNTKIDILPKKVIIKDDRIAVLDWFLDHEVCPFLEGTNVCTIYEDRPLMCRTFPRTVYTEEEKLQLTTTTGDLTRSFSDALALVNRALTAKQKP